MTEIFARTQDVRFLMLACFTTAACAAVGHHCFYQSLRGQRVDEQSYSQNQNVYIGTALTTLTKISVSAAVALAYSQVLWRRLLGRKLRISHIDSLSSLVTTPSTLDDWKILRDFPLLVALAVVAWCLSIITVFPPGTLSVVASLDNTTTSSSAPSMDFTLALVSDNSSRSVSHSGVNLEASDTTNFTFPAELKGSAGALGTVTAFTGVIPRVQTAQTNSSYSMTFFGLALECSTTQIKTNHIYCSGGDEMSYLSFLSYPQDSGSSFRSFFDLNASVPVDSSANISCNSIASFRTAIFGTKPPELFVVARTSLPDMAPDTDVPRQEWEATSCQLRNATYKVGIETSGNSQDIADKTQQLASLGLVTEYIPDFNTSSPDSLGPSANKIYDYLAMMALIGQVVVGTVNSGSDATRMSYTEGGAEDITPAPFPGIFSTPLSSSPEIQAFAEWASDARVSDSPFASARNGLPIARQLEELFRNMTAAMLTSPAISSNATVPVLHWRSVNLYKYTAWHLWLAYGIGLLAAAAVVALGFAAIIANGAPYSTKFSTFLRTVQWEGHYEMPASDGRDRGSDPPPKGIARAVMALGVGSSAASGMEMMHAKHISDEHFMNRSRSIDRRVDDNPWHGERGTSASVEVVLVSPIK